jgi:GntR family transcriptional regulator, trigonelline degradation regulator
MVQGEAAVLSEAQIQAATNLRIQQAPVTLRALALENMRAAIQSFHFKPGQRLIERDLCEQLGVSRSVVREVIRQLEAEGLVATPAHRSPIVAKLDADTAAQIYELRAQLESAAAAAAADRANRFDIEMMKTALDAIEKAYARQEPHAVIAATNSFYEAMFLCAGKTVAWEMVRRLNGRINWLRSMTIASQGRASAGPRQLHQILEAIRAKNGTKAAQACRDHLATASVIAQRLLAEHQQ